MSFAMRPGELLTQAIRRRARAQLRGAADALSDARQPLSERIHEMRTSIKKVRALIALGRSAAPRAAHRADRRLHKLATVTSDLRDAEMVLKTLDLVLAHAPRSIRDASLAGTHNHLLARLREIERSFHTDRCTESLTVKLFLERRRTKGWAPPGGDDWDNLWREPCVGLSKSYRRARRAMGRAYGELSGEAFHDWRKAVKTHRYQLQFLQGVWPRPPTTHLADLEHLGELLGQDHDLTVLEETIAGDLAYLLPRNADRNRLFSLIDQRRRALRAEARPLGERLFRERTRIFRRRLQDRFRIDAESSGGDRPATATDQRHRQDVLDVLGRAPLQVV